MADLERHIEAAQSRKSDTVETAIALERIERQLRQRKVVRWTAGVSLLSICAFFVFSTTKDSIPPRTLGELRFPDGSVASFSQTTQPEIRLERSDSHRVSVRLIKGKASFDVVKNPDRVFEVFADETTVVVTGTKFTVSTDAESTEVELKEGSVRVTNHETSIALEQGTQTFVSFVRRPTVVAVNTIEEPVEIVLDVEPNEEEFKVPKPKKKLSAVEIRKLLNEDPKRAIAAIEKRGVRDDVETLFLASDAMRGSGRHRAALKILNRVTTKHRRDARANVAEFTIGNLLLEKLADPKRAARRFSAVAPHHPLYEEALARSVLAYRRAANFDRAKTAADRYDQRFPNGSYRNVVHPEKK